MVSHPSAHLQGPELWFSALCTWEVRSPPLTYPRRWLWVCTHQLLSTVSLLPPVEQALGGWRSSASTSRSIPTSTVQAGSEQKQQPQAALRNLWKTFTLPTYFLVGCKEKESGTEPMETAVSKAGPQGTALGEDHGEELPGQG